MLPYCIAGVAEGETLGNGKRVFKYLDDSFVFGDAPRFDIVDDGLAAFVETESFQTSGLIIYRVMG
jgi:hypothetical protein